MLNESCNKNLQLIFDECSTLNQSLIVVSHFVLKQIDIQCCQFVKTQHQQEILYRLRVAPFFLFSNPLIVTPQKTIRMTGWKIRHVSKYIDVIHGECCSHSHTNGT